MGRNYEGPPSAENRPLRSTERPSLAQLQRPSNSARTRRDGGPMALVQSKLSGGKQGILLVQLCNVKRSLRGEKTDGYRNA